MSNRDTQHDDELLGILRGKFDWLDEFDVIMVR
jgi:hypothetical protein